MPVLIEDLAYNKLYKKPVYLPLDPSNKKKGSAVFLMTPNYDSTIKSMNLPYMLNNHRFESYYTEKSINFILSEEHRLLQNSDDIPLHENMISRYTRVTCTDVDELFNLGGDYEEELVDTPFIAYVFLNHNKQYQCCLILTNSGNTIFKVDSPSYRTKRDLIEMAIMMYNPMMARVNVGEDSKLYTSYGFRTSKVTANNIMVKEEAIITESLATSKIDAEIRLWQTQIAITELVIKNFGNDNWMKNMYKSFKRKLNKIPLDDFVDGVDDTVDSWKDKLKDQKATLSFYMSVKQLEVKDNLDMSNVVDEYIDWVDSLSCPKSLKLKIINEVISAYKNTIKECEFNLKRYRALDDSKKRLENAIALSTKIFSIFSFMTSGPLAPLKGIMIKSILPKSKKKNVLSETELEAKIELYTNIVEVLEERKKHIESLEESVLMEGVFSNIIGTLRKISYDFKLKSRTLRRSVKASTRDGSDAKETAKVASEDIKNAELNKRFIKKVLDTNFGGPNVLGEIFKDNGMSGYRGDNPKNKEYTKQATDIVNRLALSKSSSGGKLVFERSSYTSDGMTIPLYMISDSKSQALIAVFALVISDNYKEASLAVLYIAGKKIGPDNIEGIDFVKDYSKQESTLLEAGKSSIPTDILEFNKELNSWNYGLSSNGKKLNGNKDNYSKYTTLSLEDFKKYKIGICYDYVNYEAEWFKNHGYTFSTYYIRINDNNWNPDHVFLIFKLKGSTKSYYFESSWKDGNIGIFEFDNEEDAISGVLNMMIEKEGYHPYDIYKYTCNDSLCNVSLSKYYNIIVFKGTKLRGIDSTITESVVFSKKNLYLNFDKFEKGDSNICFVTGLSGSGKSTLATQLAAKYNAEVIELDILETCGAFNEDNIKEAGQVFYDYLSKDKDLWNRLSNHKVKGNELREEISKFIKYTISWCSKHKDTKYIIEGVQVYSLMEINQIKGKPLVIVNASMLKSIAQRMKRGWQNRDDEDSDWKNQLAEFPQLIGFYIDGEKTFNDFKRELLKEEVLSDEDRKDLPDSDFGIPSERKYPMPDESHVHSAIQMFNHVDEKYEKELASNIQKKIKEFDMTDEISVSSKNRFFNYYKPVHEGYSVSYLQEEYSLTDQFMMLEERVIFLEQEIQTLLEADTANNSILRKILYAERIKTHKEIMNLYDTVKADCPFIRYAYISYDKYKGKNLFIDWSYYTEIFFKNNYKKFDKAIDLFVDLTDRFINDSRLSDYTVKTVFIPIDDWIIDKDVDYKDYKESFNPVSVIYRLIKRGDLDTLKRVWGNYDFIFTARHGYFKMNFSKFELKDLNRFLSNVKTLINREPVLDDRSEPENSVGGMVNQVIDRLEQQKTIQINNLTGPSTIKVDDLKEKIDSANPDNTEGEVVDAITKAALTSTNADEVMDKLDSDENMKQLLLYLKTQTPDNVNVNPTRAARMRSLNDTFTKKKIANSTVGDLLDKKDEPLPETVLPVDSINDEWKHLTFMNHAKSYDLTADIVSCFSHFWSTTEPVAVRDINIENTSTSEDWVDTWTVGMEDSHGKRFTIKIDIPRLKNHRFMHLRGNDKTINGQLVNLPIIKTQENTCQMTSNYNKIFFSGYGTSAGKSYVIADRIIKTLNKEKFKDIEVIPGDNTRICNKYELPADYIDLASVFNKLIINNRHSGARYTLFFNQDELLEKYGNLIKDKNSLAIGISESDNSKEVKILYARGDVPASFQIYDFLSGANGFGEVYNTTGISVRYTYSKASILNTDIPVAIIIGYYIGLIPMLDKAGIKYTVTDKRPRYDKNLQDIIKLSDAFIVYDLDYDSSMLLNGLKETNLYDYTLAETANKRTWIEFLDNFGGRLKADGLDMFYDLMMDPITVRICNKYDLPVNFVDGLLYSNMLLSDNKYNKHTDITGNRYRTIEVIAGYTYKALCNSYTQYRRDLRAGRDARMTIKQTAVLDLLFTDNTFGDLSALTDLLEIETAGTTSFKGLSGMNSDRAYGLDKRTFDESMVNKIALSTGFSANTGINRVSTIDMDIDSNRGYIKNTNPDDMSITKTFSMAEALTPFGTVSDDPFRSAMTYIQTAKHGMRVRISDPLLVTNGADEALPYMTSDTFAYKAKGTGKIIEKTDEYMVIQYNGNNSEVVDLRERILKNSDGGMYIAVKLGSDLKVGNIVRENDIVAIDKSSYSQSPGTGENAAYNIGTLTKFAIINSDEGFEDSCIGTKWLANAMSSTVVLNKEYTLPKDTNVYFIAKKGQAIQEGEPLLIFQNSFDEEDANMLIKALSDEDGEDIVSELGRIPITSKITGVIKDIKITRTVDKEELSPSLLKIVNSYESEVKKFNKVLDKYEPDKAKTADATYKLPATGKLKNVRDSVRIEFSLAYEDDFGIGDKTVCYSALKGTIKGIMPEGLEPYSSYRKDEKIHYIQSISGDMKRMVGSILKVGALNKVMIELGRHTCDIAGIKWKYLDEY